MAPDASPPAPPAVHINAVAKTYVGPKGATEALAPISVDLAAGRTTALVGPSGCGKSTLLRLIAGLEEPTSGTVRIDGETPYDVCRRAGLAMAFQDASLLPWQTVRGNIALARKLARLPAAPKSVDHLIDLVGLKGFEGQRPAELSGGMRQRAAIARCLVSEPGLLLLDEPFGAVDELTRQRLNRDLPILWEKRGTTTVLVTHSVPEAVLLADRVLVFSRRPGAIVDDIAVSFDDRRQPGLMRTPKFRDYVDAVSNALFAGSGLDAMAAE
jgi:NitT/TauT family transport system ATP-binding protein